MIRLLAGVISLTFSITLCPAQTPPLTANTDLRPAVEGTLVLMVERPTGPIQTGAAFPIADGLVATCYHVVAGGTSATVRLPHSTELFICREVVAYDELHDLAILRVPSLPVHPLRLGDARAVTRGQRVFAIGNPSGFEGTISEGVITRINTYPESGRFDFLISTQIDHGSSGGPIVDSSGAVVGIAQRMYTPDEGVAVTYNYAQPSSYLADLLATREAYTPVRLDQLPLRTVVGALISKHTYSSELGKAALGVFDRGSQLQIRRAASDWYALPNGLYWCFRNMRVYSEAFSACYRYRTEVRSLPGGNWERVAGWKYRNTVGGRAWRLSRFCGAQGYFDREVFATQSRWDDAWKDIPPLFESKGVQPFQWDFMYFDTTGRIEWQTGEVFTTRVWSDDIVEAQGFSLAGGKFEGLVKLPNSGVLKDGRLVGEFFLVRDTFEVPPEFKRIFQDGQRDDDDPRVDVWRRSDPRWRYVPAAEFRVDAAELAWAIEEGLAELVEWEFERSVIQEGIWTRRVAQLKRQQTPLDK